MMNEVLAIKRFGEIRNHPSFRKTKCKNCNVICTKYISRNYKRERKFCSNKCWHEWERKHPMIMEKNGMWKGGKAGIAPKHQWIVRHYGRAYKCEGKDCSNISTNYDWAKISKKYTHNRKDYKMLCRSCHGKLDGWIEKSLPLKLRLKGTINRWRKEKCKK